jgi:hypothetical protein
MEYYWLSYFNNYIKKRNLNDTKIYNNENDYIIIIPSNNDFPLKNNILKINTNKAYQLFRLSNDKIIIDNKIYTINLYDSSIKINNITYDKNIYDLTKLIYYPIPHTIKIQNYREINNKYEIKLFSDIPNEYINNIPLIYIHKNELNNKLSLYENIYRYLEKNKFIGTFNF